MKLLLVYFSATGNTAKIAEVVSDELKKTGSRCGRTGYYYS